MWGVEGKPWWGPEEALLPRMGGSSPDGFPSLAFLIGPGPQPGLCTPWGHVGDLRLKAANLSCQVPGGWSCRVCRRLGVQQRTGYADQSLGRGGADCTLGKVG